MPDRTTEGVEVVRSEQRLRVGVERVPVERVRVRRAVVTETRTIEVQVRREELRIERTPVEPEAAQAFLAATAGEPGPAAQDITVVLREEVPEVVTHVRPVERVRVAVERTTVQREVRADLDREEITVEDR